MPAPSAVPLFVPGRKTVKPLRAAPRPPAPFPVPSAPAWGDLEEDDDLSEEDEGSPEGPEPPDVEFQEDARGRTTRRKTTTPSGPPLLESWFGNPWGNLNIGQFMRYHNTPFTEAGRAARRADELRVNEIELKGEYLRSGVESKIQAETLIASARMDAEIEAYRKQIEAAIVAHRMQKEEEYVLRTPFLQAGREYKKEWTCSNCLYNNNWYTDTCARCFEPRPANQIQAMKQMFGLGFFNSF